MEGRRDGEGLVMGGVDVSYVEWWACVAEIF